MDKKKPNTENEILAQMTLFSFLSYIDCYDINMNKLEDKVNKLLVDLKDDLLISEVSWGPVAYRKHELLSECLVYVVKNANENEYTIVFRGTNPFSLSSWIFQDINVVGLTPWSRQSTNTLNKTAYISKATDTSLYMHKNLTFNDQSLFDWVKSIITSTNEKITLNFCGHSLGGLMSSTFALYLYDELKYIGLYKNIDFKIFSIAAPTAGNAEYVKYMKEVFPKNYYSITNELDIVSHVWQEYDLLNLLPNIYGEIDMNKEELKFYTKLTRNTIGLNYTKISNKNIVDSKIYKNILFKNYFAQAGYQHSLPYVNFAFSNYPKLTNELRDVIESKIFKDMFKILKLSDLAGHKIRFNFFKKRKILKNLFNK